MPKKPIVIVNFRQSKFHKRLIVPWDVREEYIQQGREIDVIEKWKDLEEQKHHYKDGDKVAHTANLDQEMFVSDLLHETRGDGRNKKQSIFVGLYCHWWEKQIYYEE